MQRMDGVQEGMIGRLHLGNLSSLDKYSVAFIPLKENHGQNLCLIISKVIDVS